MSIQPRLPLANCSKVQGKVQGARGDAVTRTNVMFVGRLNLGGGAEA